MYRLVERIKQAVAAFVGCKTTSALIGGLVLVAHQVVRAMRDVDFLAYAEDADKLHEILLTLGCRCVDRSEEAANYLRGDESLVCMRIAQRHGACSPTWRNVPRPWGRCVISAKGLISLYRQNSNPV